MDVFPKFIIEFDEESKQKVLIISKCTFHKDICMKESNVLGGGMFKYDNENKTFTLYGKSDQFGSFRKEYVEECINNKMVFTNPYLTHNISDKYNFIVE